MVPAPFLEQESKFREITMFSKVYDAHYRTAYKMFKENIFFGVGNKMYRKKVPTPLLRRLGGGHEA